MFRAVIYDNLINEQTVQMQCNEYKYKYVALNIGLNLMKNVSVFADVNLHFHVAVA